MPEHGRGGSRESRQFLILLNQVGGFPGNFIGGNFNLNFPLGMRS